MVEGWKGKLVRLVPMEAERHMDNAIRWLNDPEVTEFVLIGDMPITRAFEESWFKRIADSMTDINFAIETHDGKHIGMTGVHEINYRHGHAITGTIIGEKELWGKGLGTDVVAVRTRYCFEVLGLRVLESGYLEGNERTPKMLAKSGFKEVGRIPQRYWKRGKYRDHILMAVTRDEWLRHNQG